MSADNWSPCPFCSKDYEDKIRKLTNDLETAYENITAKRYDMLKQEVEAKINSLNEEKESNGFLRVDGLFDYEFDDNGVMYLHMKAFCNRCKKEWTTKGIEVHPQIRKQNNNY